MSEKNKSVIDSIGGLVGKRVNKKSKSGALIPLLIEELVVKSDDLERDFS